MFVITKGSLQLWQWCITRESQLAMMYQDDLQGEETKENKSFGKCMQMVHQTLAMTI
jgi:hypothetical protein